MFFEENVLLIAILISVISIVLHIIKNRNEKGLKNIMINIIINIALIILIGIICGFLSLLVGDREITPESVISQGKFILPTLIFVNVCGYLFLIKNINKIHLTIICHVLFTILTVIMFGLGYLVLGKPKWFFFLYLLGIFPLDDTELELITLSEVLSFAIVVQNLFSYLIAKGILKMNNKIKGIKGNFNHKKKSKIPFLLAALIILILALISGDSDDDYPSYNSVTYGGQTYKTVQIGSQTWMAENLNYDAEGSECYKFNPAYCAKYGRLYDWETALEVCPDGWHLPSGEEWDKLFRFVDGDKGTKSPYNSKIAGKHLKAKSGWKKRFLFIISGNGTNKYGFSALPGGYHSTDGGSYGVGIDGHWWSANEGAYHRTMGYYDNEAEWSYFGKYNLLSVRCVQD